MLKLQHHQLVANSVRAALAEVQTRANIIKKQADYCAGYFDDETIMFGFTAELAAECFVHLNLALERLAKLEELADPNRAEELPF